MNKKEKLINSEKLTLETNTKDEESDNFKVGFYYKTHIGKLLPLSYVVTEIENYLESAGTGDSLVLVTRDSYPSIKELCDNGIIVVKARSNAGKEFVVFYKAKYNQFGLFLQKQTGKDTTGKDTFDYHLISSWNITIEDGNWFDGGVPVAEEE